MNEQNPGEPLREYLDRRETELLRSIDALHGQLRPRESELAEIRRAKGALGIPTLHLVTAQFGVGLEIVSAADKPSSEAQAAPPSEALPTGAVMPAVTVAPSDVTVASPSLASPEIAPDPAGGRNSKLTFAGGEAMTDIMMSRDTSLVLRMSAYQHLTMKQLVIKALKEHFNEGATTKQLLEFFRDAWGRNIERTNLSPQVTRLRIAGLIEHHDGKWRLTRLRGVSADDLIAINHWPAGAQQAPTSEQDEEKKLAWIDDEPDPKGSDSPVTEGKGFNSPPFIKRRKV